MNRRIFKTTTLLLIMAAIFAGCNKQPSNAYNETAEKEKFCSFVNIKNIDKTIPIVNEFLSRLSAGLDDEQQLQILVTWLQSCICIVDAAVLSQTENETLPMSEILISFDENEITKELIIDVSMEKPLKVTGYRKYEAPVEESFPLKGTRWKAVGVVNDETGYFRALEPNDGSNRYILTFCMDSVLYENGWYKYPEPNTITGFSCSNGLVGFYVIDYIMNTLQIRIHTLTLVGEFNDGILFVELLNDVHTFSLQRNELKLYFDDKKNYLFFKQLQP